MQNRVVRCVWPLALAMLAILLAACGASPGTAALNTATLAAPTSTTPAAPTATVVPASSTPLPPAASPSAATTATPATTAPPAASATPAGPAPTATLDPAVAAVLAYLQARASTDLAAATNLSCKSWKSKAATEVTSFRSMNAKLVGVTCRITGSAGLYTLVGCGGKMVTTYGGEARDWDLSTFVYQVIAEDGQWKMCGYH